MKRRVYKSEIAVYVVRCEDNALYVGMTKDPTRRWREHQEGRGSWYTQFYKPISMSVCAWVRGKKKAEALEIAMTEALGALYLKVAGGVRTYVSASGRGREWRAADLEMYGMLGRFEKLTFLQVNLPCEMYYYVDGQGTRPWNGSTPISTSLMYTDELANSEIIGL